MSDLIDRQKAIDDIEECAEKANRSYKYDEELGLLKAREILIDAQPVQDCGDAISRERALKEMTFSDAIRTDDNILYVPLKDVNKHLQNIPSAQPELFGNSEQLDGEYDPRPDIYYIAEKIGIYRLYALVVQLRGEPESCIDTIGRKAAIDAAQEWFDGLIVGSFDGLKKKLEAVPSVQPEPCEDAVSRNEVFNVIEDVAYDVDAGVGSWYGLMNDKVRALQSVQPERKKGKWIFLDECSNSGYYCSKCNKKIVKEGWSNTVKKIKFCPNCGSDMRPTEKE